MEVLTEKEVTWLHKLQRWAVKEIKKRWKENATRCKHSYLQLLTIQTDVMHEIIEKFESTCKKPCPPGALSFHCLVGDDLPQLVCTINLPPSLFIIADTDHPKPLFCDAVVAQVPQGHCVLVTFKADSQPRNATDGVMQMPNAAPAEADEEDEADRADVPPPWWYLIIAILSKKRTPQFLETLPPLTKEQRAHACEILDADKLYHEYCDGKSDDWIARFTGLCTIVMSFFQMKGDLVYINRHLMQVKAAQLSSKPQNCKLSVSLKPQLVALFVCTEVKQQMPLSC